MNHPQIQQFLDQISPWADTYSHSTLSFITLRHANEPVILAARLRLAASPLQSARPLLRTAHLTAGEAPVVATNRELPLFIRSLLAGEPILVGDHTIKYAKPTEHQPTAFLHTAAAAHRGPRRPAYVDHLRIDGIRRSELLDTRLTQLERELQPCGYRSVRDLMEDWGFDLYGSDFSTVEFIPEPVVRFGHETTHNGQSVTLSVRLAGALSVDRVTLTVVDSYTQGKTLRLPIDPKSVSWSREQDWVGKCSVEVPGATIATCRALYDGAEHDAVELSDTRALPNRYRMLVELADSGLQRLSEPLIDPKSDKQRDEFEAGVAVLLYMLGFKAVRVGGIKKASDAADILALSDSGEILVVECTTGVLDPKDKLNKLLSRLAAARARALEQKPGRHVHRDVVGLIVIPKGRDELMSLRRIAQEHGLIVLSREDIAGALERTRFPPDPDAFLQQWRQLSTHNWQIEGLPTDGNL